MKSHGARRASVHLTRLAVQPSPARSWFVSRGRCQSYGQAKTSVEDGGLAAASAAKRSVSFGAERMPLVFRHVGREPFFVSAGNRRWDSPRRKRSTSALSPRDSHPSLSAISSAKIPQSNRLPANGELHPANQGGVTGDLDVHVLETSADPSNMAPSRDGGPSVKGPGLPGKSGSGESGRTSQRQVSYTSETRARSSYRLPSSSLWLSSLDSGGWSWKGASQQPNLKPHRMLTAQEWDDILLQPDPTDALRELAWRSMLKDEQGEYVHPDLKWLRDIVDLKYGDRKDLDIKKTRGAGKILINHVLQVVKQSPCRLRVRWAALLHDVGKPATVELGDESRPGRTLTFHRHEIVGACMVSDILSQYGYGVKFQREVASLVLRSGRIRMVEMFQDQGARRLMSVLGPLLTDLVDLYHADSTTASSWKQQEHYERGKLLMRLVKDVLFKDKIRLKKPPLDGHDVMALTGLKEGVLLGRVLSQLRREYLLRGPFSKEESIQVVHRLHQEYSQKLGLPRRAGERRSRYEKEEEMLTLLRKSDEAGEVLVFRVQLEQRSNGEAGAHLPEIFRDVIVQRSTTLFDFAHMISLAFDFDFDDRFSFYRRRFGTVCPGAAAACSGISEALIPHRASHPPDEADLKRAEVVQAVVEGPRDDGEGQKYELLASSTGVPRDLECSAHAYSYDVRFSAELGCWINPQGKRIASFHETSPDMDASTRGGSASDPHSDCDAATHGVCVSGVERVEGTEPGQAASGLAEMGGQTQAKPACPLAQGPLAQGPLAQGPSSAEGSGDLGDDEAFWNCKADTLAYPLMIPQKGPADLCNTCLGSLFDRTRRSMLLVLDNGGPWRITIDFVQARARKEYEVPPRVIARMGLSPRQYVHGKPKIVQAHVPKSEGVAAGGLAP